MSQAHADRMGLVFIWYTLPSVPIYCVNIILPLKHQRESSFPLQGAQCVCWLPSPTSRPSPLNGSRNSQNGHAQNYIFKNHKGPSENPMGEDTAFTHPRTKEMFRWNFFGQLLGQKFINDNELYIFWGVLIQPPIQPKILKSVYIVMKYALNSKSKFL